MAAMRWGGGGPRGRGGKRIHCRVIKHDGQQCRRVVALTNGRLINRSKRERGGRGTGDKGARAGRAPAVTVVPRGERTLRIKRCAGATGSVTIVSGLWASGIQIVFHDTLARGNASRATAPKFPQLFFDFSPPSAYPRPPTYPLTRTPS